MAVGKSTSLTPPALSAITEADLKKDLYAIMYADRIKTPLLLISGGQDHNVPAEQSRKMFYALRRLGKEVEWVNYTNAGHGMPTTTVEEMKDYHKRILDWYNNYLKADPKKKAEDAKSVTSVQ